MNQNTESIPAGESRWKLSLDSWAVLFALLAALLIRVGILKHVPW
jgi:hypothetical protein